MKKKIAIIGTVGIPARYGGFETCTEMLVKNLTNKFDFIVYCSSKAYEEKFSNYNNAKLVYIPLKANGVQSIFYDILSIFHALKNSDLLLILGVSGAICLPFVKIFFKKKILVNIDGMDWKREKWNIFARSFLKFSEKIAVKYGDIIISDNKHIQSYLRETYEIDSSLIEYGGDNAVCKNPFRKFQKESPFSQKNYFLATSRIEPENNIELILNSFSMMPEKNLVVVGNWSGNKYGLNLKKKFHSSKNIFLIEFLTDQEHLNCIRSSCYCYIHGHSSGGTNPSLVEAMHLGIPVLAYDVPYNRETTENKALYFNNLENLKKLIYETSDESIKELAAEMKKIASRRYTWERISGEYSKLFE